MIEFVQFGLNGVFLGAIYGLLAMALALTWTTTDVVDVSVGAYAMTAGIVAAAVGFPLGLLVGVGAAVALGCIGGLIFLSFQLVKGGRDQILLVLGSFGLLLVIESAVLTYFGTAGRFLPRIGGRIEIGAVSISVQNLINFAASLVVLGCLLFLLKRTMLGLSMRACAISEDASKLAGIAVRKNQYWAFVLGAGIAGIAGTLAVLTIGLSYSSAFTLTIAGFGGAVVLGLRGPATAFAGGMLIGVAETLSQGFLPSGWAPAIPSLIIVAVLATGKLQGTSFATARP